MRAWEPAPEPLPLDGDTAQVWRADVDQLRTSLPRFASVLSDEERSRAARFVREDDRERSVIARGLLRTLLGATLGIAPERVRFRTGARGKPAMAFPTSDLAFNVSHSGDRILIAMTRGREVGVDVERIRAPLGDEALAATFFSPWERAALSRLSDGEQAAAFYTIWTRKEASLKAWGAGLLAPLDSFSVPLTPIPPGRPYVVRAAAARARAHRADPTQPRWALHDLPPIPGYAAALALEWIPQSAGNITCLLFVP